MCVQVFLLFLCVCVCLCPRVVPMSMCPCHSAHVGVNGQLPGNRYCVLCAFKVGFRKGGHFIDRRYLATGEMVSFLMCVWFGAGVHKGAVESRLISKLEEMNLQQEGFWKKQVIIYFYHC